MIPAYILTDNDPVQNHAMNHCAILSMNNFYLQPTSNDSHQKNMEVCPCPACSLMFPGKPHHLPKTNLELQDCLRIPARFRRPHNKMLSTNQCENYYTAPHAGIHEWQV